MSEPSITIVIPSWNGRDLLRECLNSLRVQENRPFEIVVIDDGSTDGTADLIAREFPEVRAVRLPVNRGFCAAVNAGIATSTGEWVFLLNNDMTLRPDCLRRLIQAARDGDAHLLAPLVLWKEDPHVIYAAGDFQGRNGRPESIGFMQPLAGFTMPDGIFGISAGAGLYHRAVFDKIGLFDELFDLYFSDSDVNFRARAAGFRAKLVPEAVCYHVGSAHLSGNTWKRTRQCYINHALLVVKNIPLPLMIKYAPHIIAERVHQARRVFSAARTAGGSVHAARQLFLAWLEMLRKLPYACRGHRLNRHLQRKPGGPLKHDM